MKNYNLISFKTWLLIPSVLLFTVSSLMGIENRKKIVENVSVVNVEVPVRVFFKGNPVDNLKKEDFIIFEDGKRQKINGFWIERKKIKVSGDKEIDDVRTVSHPARFFVLVFRTTKFNKELEKGIGYIFEKVLSDEDRLMIFVNNRTLLLENLKKRKNILPQVLDLVSEESRKARIRQIGVVEKIRSLIRKMRMELALLSGRGNPADELKRMLENYLAAWNEYKSIYLTPVISNYYNFARYLEKIKGDKWVINFYQFEIFPKLRPSGEVINYIKNLINDLRISVRGEDIAYSQTLSRLLMRIDIALNVTSDFPTEQISKLFYKVGAVFHSIFIKTRDNLNSQDIQYRRISTNIENNFRELTKITGGELISSNKVGKSLEKIVRKKDILYTLTYYPTDENKKGKIKVSLKQKGYKVIYDDNIRKNYIKKYFEKMEKKIPTVKILYSFFNKGKLKVAVKGYYLRKEGKKRIAKLKVRIRIIDSDGNSVFNREKILLSEKKMFTLSLNFSQLKKGEYSCVISVLDLLTDKSDMKYLYFGVD